MNTKNVIIIDLKFVAICYTKVYTVVIFVYLHGYICNMLFKPTISVLCNLTSISKLSIVLIELDSKYSKNLSV